MQREKEGYELIGDKMSMWRAANRADGILRRRAFIAKLSAILHHRKTNGNKKES